MAPKISGAELISRVNAFRSDLRGEIYVPDEQAMLLRMQLINVPSIDEYIKVGRELNPPLGHDYCSFARVMRMNSKEFMDFWMFAQSTETNRYLIFYKEFCHLLDALASQIPAQYAASVSYSRARAAGLTPPMMRFLSFHDVLDTSSPEVLSIPQFPVITVPQGLCSSYESLASTYVLNKPTALDLPADVRNKIAQRFPKPTAHLMSDGLDEMAHAVLENLFENTFRNFILSKDALRVSKEEQFGVASDTVSILSKTSMVKEVEFSTSVKFGKKGFSNVQQLLKPNDDEVSNDASQNSRELEVPIPLYSKPAVDGRELQNLLLKAGFSSSKGFDKTPLMYTPASFVKTMNMSSPLYIKFASFAKENGFGFHIEFYERICELDDAIAAQISSPSVQVARTYAECRTSGLTQALSRFLRKIPESPVGTHFSARTARESTANFPEMPEIPQSVLPSQLKSTVTSLFTKHVAQAASRGIACITHSHRSGVLAALQMETSRPLRTDLMDACTDDVVDALYDDCFRSFVGRDSHEFVAVGTGIGVQGAPVRRLGRRNSGGSASSLGRVKSPGVLSGLLKGIGMQRRQSTRTSENKRQETFSADDIATEMPPLRQSSLDTAYSSPATIAYNSGSNRSEMQSRPESKLASVLDLQNAVFLSQKNLDLTAGSSLDFAPSSLPSPPPPFLPSAKARRMP
ncbi:hypothetical protein HDU82_000516 [Entophlyctis luteolus]|nr:hypothetical protein HDU82_000516 [Entophlyctis luteolus]